MKRSRRQFLKVASLSVLGLSTHLATGGIVNAAQQGEQYLPNEHGLKAGRWAMVIDTRAFETPADFEACVTACHKAHNVPHIPNHQDIKWLWTDKYEHVFPEQSNNHMSEALEKRDFLVLCNHCENPPCVRVCPTKATYKRPDGIVAMDYHRCIGCRFCMAGCPYGARSFNFSDPRKHLDMAEVNPEFPTRMIGVVEKCNFCVERLAQGLMPACVEAAEGKIVFGDLNDPESEVRKVLAENFTIRRKPAVGTQPGVYYII
ncbi:4Fe-4S dicluster domain-containing protein [Desulfovibrio subterraneus]|jgi:molybdopterin-containing oxidoreductase family iron-sulfur binding subunit|uniref:sulfate reduction electron transfer complex DsrMKJOP subunit DsrO n=1 Tax=Desulfovibrio subterraneus TaxID=2718620 RepID=UPI0022B8E78D|nr:4Fe-4S dicluster domain-containing protein [Desulfovibrio subterraneus]WBF68403.1 4Fe-4S dicluster domain-containing protein [Desulfovibrio subterraneus]